MSKLLRIIGALLIVCPIIHSPAIGGGPEIFIDKAHVDDVIFDHRGIVLIVSGTARLSVPRVARESTPPEPAKLVILPIKRGELRYLGGELYAVSLAGRKAYQARIRSMKGTIREFQLWGTSAVIEGGHLVRVVARIATHLTPLKGERRFAIDRLHELEEP